MIWPKHIARYFNKKTTLVVGFLLLFMMCGLAFILVRNYAAPESSAAATGNFQKTLSEQQRQEADKDSDGDGLKDWEEAIFQTDPHKADTDGDGTLDGKEIADGRNPLKVGPDDKLEAPKVEVSDELQNHSDVQQVANSGNITQMIMQQVLKNHGLKELTNVKNAGSISDEMLGYLAQLKNQTKEFSPDAIPDSQLHISDDSSSDAVKAYFNATAAIYEQYAKAQNIDDFSIIRDAFTEKSSDPLTQLQQPMETTALMRTDIQAITVPRSVLLLHKKELWYLQNTTEELQLLKQAKIEDPLYVLLLLNMRKETKAAIGSLHSKEIPTWLAQNSIIFTAWDKAAQVYPVPIQ